MKRSLTLVVLLGVVALGFLVSWQAGLFANLDPVPEEEEIIGAGSGEKATAPVEETSGHYRVPGGDEAKGFLLPAAGKDRLRLPLASRVDAVVLDGRSGEPLPGAAVAWHSTRLAMGGFHPPLPAHLDNPYLRVTTDVGCLQGNPAPLERFGEVIRADNSGRLTLPRIPGQYGHVRLRGRWRNLEGFFVLPANLAEPEPAEPLRLRLYPPREIKILVVDRGGQPRGGVPLGVLAGSGERRWTRLWLGRSGPDGTALARFLVPAEIEGWRLCLAALPITRETDLVPLPAETRRGSTLRLQVPPTGSLTVEVVDRRERPVKEPLLVRMFVGGMPVGEMAGGLAAYTKGGKTSFLSIPLGQKYIFRLSSPGRPPNYGAQYRFGPTREQTDKTVQVPWNRQTTLFRGRALDEQGRPLVRQTLFAWERFFPTDGDGRFAIRPKYDIRKTRTWAMKVELTWWRGTNTMGQALGPTARLTILPPIPPTGLDVGDVSFTPHRVLARGRVQDEEGRPVPGVKLEACYLEAKGPGEKLGATATDGRGAFTVTGPRLGRVAVRPGKKGWACPHRYIPLAEGERVSTITVERTGALAYSLRHPPEIPRSMLKVSLKCESPRFRGHEKGMRFPFHRMAEADEEDLENLYPGDYTMLVRARDLHLARIEGIPIRPGRTTRRPDLDPLDLTGRVKVHRFTITGPGKLDPLEVGFMAQKEEGGRILSLDGYWEEPRTFVLALPREYDRVAVTVKGHLPVMVIGPKARNPIDLSGHPEGVTVRIRVTGEPEGFIGFPTLRYTGPACAGVEPILLNQCIGCQFNSNDRNLYTYFLPCAGPYRVVWQWRPGNDRHAPFELMQQRSYKTLEVEAGSAVRTYRIELKESQVPGKG